MAPLGPMRAPNVALLCALTFGLAACDSEPEGPTEAEKAAAEKKAKEDKELEERIAARKAKEAEAEKAREDAEKAKAEAVDKLTVLPEKMPKNLDKACKEVAAANDRFMTRLYTGEAVEKWNQAKGTQLAMTSAQCNKFGSLEAAACQINAMDNATEAEKKALPDLLRACNEKFPKKE